MELPSRTIARTIGGQSVTFHKLGLRTMAEMVKAHRAASRASLLATLKDAGADKSQLAAELHAFDEREPDDGLRWHSTVMSYDGRIAVLRAAMPGKTEAERDAIIDAIEPGDVLPLVAELCGLQLQTEPEPSANPTAAPPATEEQQDSYGPPKIG